MHGQMSSGELGPDKVQRYASTVLEIGNGPDVVVDLRRRLSSAEMAALEHVCSEPFTVITAENPLGQDQPAKANARATARLRASLEAAGLSFVAATGRDPADTHREAGFAVTGALEPVLELALEFGQDAVFRYERNGFLLVESATGRRHVLPLEKEGDLKEEKP